MSFAYMTALELKGLLAERSISPVELVEDTLSRQDALEPQINAFVNRTPEQALAAAREAERAIGAGEGGAIAGLPVSVKDLVPVAGVPWTFGSRPFADNVVDFDAPSVERIRQAGGCIIGKSTTSEFGCKAVCDSPLSGITRNPWDLTKTSGGSSGGAGASVAAGLTPFALGTDGGGSVRIPSALCGLFGIKAQFGRVPIFPVSAAPTLAHVGSIARTVRDAALLLGVMAGHDRRDAFGVAEPTPDFLAACDAGVEGLRIAWSPTLGYAQPEPEVAALCEAAARRFEALGCTVELVEDALGTDPVELWMAEFYGGIGTKLKDLMAERPDELDSGRGGDAQRRARPLDGGILHPGLRPLRVSRANAPALRALRPAALADVALRRLRRGPRHAAGAGGPQHRLLGLLHLSVQPDRPAGGFDPGGLHRFGSAGRPADGGRDQP